MSKNKSNKKENQKLQRPLIWLQDEIEVPPFTGAAAQEAYEYLERIREGESFPLPTSRPMPSIGTRCHELRITDEDVIWRIFYRTDPDAIVIAAVLCKKTQKTPTSTIKLCKQRYKHYDNILS